MTKKSDFTFLSSDRKTQLHGIRWLPEGEATAVVQLCHGVAEYIDRYDSFARFLNEKGVAVVGHDHLGHGLSIAEGEVPVHFGKGNTWQTVVNDIYVLHTALKKDFPAVPHVLLGHSMGSFLARSYLIRYPSTVQAAIIMGTGWQGSLALNGGIAIAGLLGAKNDEKTSDFITKLAFGSYNKPFQPNRSNYDWLSVDEQNVNDYCADPLCGQAVTVGLFREMLKGIRFNQRFANLDKMDGKTPVLLISGALDPVGDRSAGVRQTYLEFKRSGVADCTMKLYPGLRHEILNEKAQQSQIYGDLWAWIEEKTR